MIHVMHKNIFFYHVFLDKGAIAPASALIDAHGPLL
jgi:hypothetical protein